MAVLPSSVKSISDKFEESLIAFLLGSMTLITFANVVARRFDGNILWALEATVFLFAWLVLIGASYGVKRNFHIGVDVVVRLFPKPIQRILALVAVTACLAFSLIMLIGSWDYWWAFATKRAFFEVNDVPMPDFLQFLAHWLNEGEEYEKIPRFIPYAALPISMALLTFRFAQVALSVLRGERFQIVENHEFEELADEPSSTGDR